MEDVHSKLGGIPTVIQYCIENKLMKGEHMTVTGYTLAENADRWTHKRGKFPRTKMFSTPSTSLSSLLVTFVSSRVTRSRRCCCQDHRKGRSQLHGKARVFDTEDAMVAAVEKGEIKKGEKTVVVLRYKGPKGGPGMPEMLKPTV